MAEKTIDVHIHVGGPGGAKDDDQSGCEWSKDFESTEAFVAFMLSSGTTYEKLTQTHVTGKVLKTLRKSKVDRGVLLAFDNVHDLDGRKYGVADDPKKRSHLVTPNHYIARLKAENPERVLFGCSIHPYREKSDLERELSECVAGGAVLCKWIPSAQMIDPSHEKCRAFYDLLKENRLPLLMHTGPEPSVPSSYREDPAFGDPFRFNDPSYLRFPLERGVTAIAAHCATPYYGVFDPRYKQYLDSLAAMFKEAAVHNWPLYADVSALCSIFISGDIITRIQNEFPRDRLILGSDYPVPISALSFSRIKPGLIDLIKMHFKNPLDLNMEMLFDHMGFSPEIKYNAWRMFKQLGREL